MDSASVISPSSDERFWGRLRDRVEIILEDRKPMHNARSSPSICGVESERGKRFREDSMLLIRGLDSASSSLNQLTNTLSTVQQEVSYLAKSSPTKEPKREAQGVHEENIEPKAKKRCVTNELPDNHDGAGSDKLPDSTEVAGPIELKEDKQISVNAAESGNLKKAKNLAISMASKAVSLARELKTIKSDFSFMQERCTLLEEENRRLREAMEEGDRPEEDDLVRLQLEALLAEKSRLANENANLTRENQCLHQLVEYHQLTSQDLLSSYDQDMLGIRLDFSSPLGKIDSDPEDEDGDRLGEVPCSPSIDRPGLTSSLDECHEEQRR